MLPRAAFRQSTILRLQFRVRKCFDWSEERPIGEKSGDFAVPHDAKDVIIRRLRLNRDDPVIAEKPAILRPEVPVPDLTYRPPAVEQPKEPVSQEPAPRLPQRFRAIHKSPKPAPVQPPPPPQPTKPTRQLQAHLDDPLLVTVPPCIPPEDTYYAYRYLNFLAAKPMPEGLVLSRTGKKAVIINPQKGGVRPVGLMRDFPWTRLRRLKRIIYLEQEDGKIPKEWEEIRGPKAARVLKRKMEAGQDTMEPEFLVVRNRDMLVWHRGPLGKNHATIEATIDYLKRTGALRLPPSEEQKPAHTPTEHPKEIPSSTMAEEEKPEERTMKSTTNSGQTNEFSTNSEKEPKEDDHIPSDVNATTEPPEPIDPEHISQSPTPSNPATTRPSSEETEENPRLTNKQAKKLKHKQHILEAAAELDILPLSRAQRREIRVKEYIMKNYGPKKYQDEGYGPIITDKRVSPKKDKKPRFSENGKRGQPKFRGGGWNKSSRPTVTYGRRKHTTAISSSTTASTVTTESTDNDTHPLKRRRLSDISNTDHDEPSPKRPSTGSLTQDTINSAGNTSTSTKAPTPTTASSSPSKPPLKSAFTLLRRLPNSVSKKPRPKPSSLKPAPKLTQMTLDLGQSTLLTCAVCSMSYSPSVDSLLHTRFHNGVSKGISALSSWTDPIVTITSSSPAAWKKKAKEVMEVVDTELSAASIPEKILWIKGGRYKLFLGVEAGMVVAALLAERIEEGFLAVDNGVRWRGKRKALVGVCRVWVARGKRGLGWGKRLIEEARKGLVYGMVVQRDMVAFSQLTESGAALARAWWRDGKRGRNDGGDKVRNNGKQDDETLEEKEGEKEEKIEGWLVYVERDSES
ncbi:hypothetical protein BZA77DRAFT_388890 [Pyronema omphalodes]|nr:hypothetical protein BZA77DRAFT_388890 [Pyronema omphalodes]